MKRSLGYWLLALAGAALLGLGASQSGRAAEGMGPEAREACAALKTLPLTFTRITMAEAIAPKKLWPYPKSIFSAILPPGAKAGVEVPFCRVAGTIEKEINFEVWLPVQWNGKFMGVGNGGYSGALNYTTMGAVIGRGYATASTDTGHKTPTDFFDEAWIAGHPLRVLDFGHRGHHLVAVIAKKIVAAFYGEEAKHAYFTGCSSGGWQGLTEAQKYPEDYDGIIAGAPANNFVRLQTRGFWLAKHAASEPAGSLGEKELSLLVKSAVARCDAKDGVTDGIIGDPEACDFDPKQLQCKKGETAECLTAAQVKRARLIYGPAKSAKGLALYPGNAYGTAPFAPFPLPGSANPPAADNPALMKMTRELVGEPPFTAATFDPDRDIPWLDEKIGPVLSSADPDLSAFAARGGKLILYHGWSDALLSPYNTIAYYKSVRAEIGRKATEKSVRLFMAPGMAHCAGGPGPDRFDMVAALEAWVEKGETPERIIAESWREDLTVARSRPLCAYPKVAKYTGQGSTDDAANFVCK
jgi:feruloyl esterase